MKQMIQYIVIGLLVSYPLLVNSQSFKVYNSFDDFEPLLEQKNDTLYVINFWATWCDPCVKELPDFQQVNQKFKNDRFKMILVSLDFEKQLESKVKPFVREKQIDVEVVLLTDTKQNQWIDKVDKQWSGSIPITVIYSSDFYFFKEGSMDFEELNEIITKNIKQ